MTDPKKPAPTMTAEKAYVPATELVDPIYDRLQDMPATARGHPVRWGDRARVMNCPISKLIGHPRRIGGNGRLRCRHGGPSRPATDFRSTRGCAPN